jgi:hypothetical protein
LAYSRVE